MGYLLKEVLKTLCGVNQWSYAVFWKIGFQNPKLLIWEECYHEPTPCSALPHIPRMVSSQIAFEEWEACLVSPGTRTPQIGVQAEDKVGSLINKMMMGNWVNIVGEGLVGQAAFTGDHMWILSENYARETHPPEVQNEVSQQFSSGMKTVAVIPVLTHGVVQLGSSLAITENMPFVNGAKSLILQLGHVPGALLSDNYISKEPAPKLGVPVCLGKSVSTDPSGSYKGKYCVSHVAEQSISSCASELICQPSCSLIRQIEDNPQDTSSAMQAPKPAQNVVKSHNSFSKPKIIPVPKPNLPLSDQLENGETGAEMISSNPEQWLKQQASLYNPRHGFSEQSCDGLSSINCSNLRLMEEHILSDVLQEHVSNSLSTSRGFISSQPRANGGGSSSSCQLPYGACSHLGSILNCCAFPTANASANLDVSCMNLIGSGPNASRLSTSDLTDRLATSHLFSGSSDLRHHPNIDNCSQMEVAHRKERIEDDLFQAFNIPSAHLDEPNNLIENISGFCHGSQKHDYGNQNPSSKNAKYRDDFVQSSSGDDLFDILGPDFKSKLFHESWNHFLNDGPDRSTKILGKNNCKPLHLEDVNSELYSISGGNSASCVLSGTGTDHLLDAIVNTAHTAANQSSDDTVSCGTTLTKISSSSLPDASPSHGRAVFDKIQGELFRDPKSLEKLGVVGSCSFKSEFSKEDAGNYSQTSSIYGSQISSRVEQGRSMTQISCASTTYSKKPDEVSKSHPKRLKPGENPKPRPKDRQMIQDRMKELREIVPNGAKCSIDALLERTIKHMLFLQSVTKHADKLKQTGESKIIGKDGGLLLKDNFEGGRTWAYEVGSQSMVCPIIVEDLNPPRQMLVEMLCEEHGWFLEIADIIRGLGLTILKGLMETRNGKIWARFAVEANRDVTRMEIFLSLVHLLEETVKSCAASGNDVENDNMMVQQSFHQAASMPANW